MTSVAKYNKFHTKNARFRRDSRRLPTKISKYFGSTGAIEHVSSHRTDAPHRELNKAGVYHTIEPIPTKKSISPDMLCRV